MIDLKSLLSGAKNIKTEYTMQFDVENFQGNIENILDKTGLFYGKEYQVVQCLQAGNITTFTFVARS